MRFRRTSSQQARERGQPELAQVERLDRQPLIRIRQTPIRRRAAADRPAGTGCPGPGTTWARIRVCSSIEPNLPAGSSLRTKQHALEAAGFQAARRLRARGIAGHSGRHHLGVRRGFWQRQLRHRLTGMRSLRMSFKKQRSGPRRLSRPPTSAVPCNIPIPTSADDFPRSGGWASS